MYLNIIFSTYFFIIFQIFKYFCSKICIYVFYAVILGLFYVLGARTIKNNNDLCDDLGHSLDGIGKILVIILFASVLLNIYKYSNIGNVVVANLARLLNTASITGIPLIILLFIIGMISTIFLPNSQAKWALLATTAVPAFMNSGLSPEYAQTIFRFSECATICLTPLLAYYVIYLAYIEKYNQNTSAIAMFRTLKYQIPYAIATAAVLIILAVAWYLIGVPIGINGATVI